MRPGASPQHVQAPVQPDWFPLSPAHEKYVDEILKYWEFKSSQVKRYRCNFRCWEYDYVYGPRDTFVSYSIGEVKYSAPDKGLFRATRKQQYQPPKVQGGKPTYAEVPDRDLEHWVCDGHWIWQFNYQQSKLVQYELPPEMRGKAIANGPLPFLFNAKAEDIKRRFWIHAIAPNEKKQDEYWLEAVPKTGEDAADFGLVHFIIDQKDFLPKVIVLFKPGNSGSRTTFEFTDREINFSILAEQLNLFHREFFEPAVPSGWVKEVQKWNEPVTPPEGPASTARATSERGPQR